MTASLRSATAFGDGSAMMPLSLSLRLQASATGSNPTTSYPALTM